MKKVENKIIKLSEKDSQTYGELIMVSVKSPSLNNQGQPQGYDYETLKKIQRVDKVIGTDKLVKDYDFEDTDFDFIKSKVQSMQWGIYNEALIKFIAYILEEVK